MMPWISKKLDEKIQFSLFRTQVNNLEKEQRKIDLFSPDSNETRLIIAIISCKELQEALDKQSKEEGKKLEGIGKVYNYEHEELFGSERKFYYANICQVNDEMTGNVKERILYIDKVLNEDKDDWYNFEDFIQLKLIDSDLPYILDIRVDEGGFKKYQMNIKKRDGTVGQRLSTVGKFISESFHYKKYNVKFKCRQMGQLLPYGKVERCQKEVDERRCQKTKSLVH